MQVPKDDGWSLVVPSVICSVKKTMCYHRCTLSCAPRHTRPITCACVLGRYQGLLKSLPSSGPWPDGLQMLTLGVSRHHHGRRRHHGVLLRCYAQVKDVAEWTKHGLEKRPRQHRINKRTLNVLLLRRTCAACPVMAELHQAQLEPSARAPVIGLIEQNALVDQSRSLLKERMMFFVMSSKKLAWVLLISCPPLPSVLVASVTYHFLPGYGTDRYIPTLKHNWSIPGNFLEHPCSYPSPRL